jgi:hypothetical protein
LAQAKIQTSRQLLFYLSLSLSLLANNTALEEAIIHLMFPAIFTQGRQSLSWVALSFALYYSLSLSLALQRCCAVRKKKDDDGLFFGDDSLALKIWPENDEQKWLPLAFVMMMNIFFFFFFGS